MTPKARAQEALDQMDPLHFGMGHDNDLPMKAWQYLCANGPTIIEALKLSAALERVPLMDSFECSKRNGKWKFWAYKGPINETETLAIGEGKSAAAAILAAVEKMEKK